jgi:PAS domain S-box-containing protein
MTFFLNEEFYRKIVEDNPNGIVICDENLKIIYINKQLGLLTGFSIEDLKEKNIVFLISSEKDDCLICKSETGAFSQGEASTHRGELKTKKDDNILVKIDHNPVELNNKHIYITTISPLSETVCLNQAHLDFVSTVSHELRTPLTSIKGFAETLLTSNDRLTKEQRQRFLSIIKNQIDRLSRLVENLLTVSRLESKKSKSIYKVINLKSLIEPIVQVLQCKFPEHTFEVIIDKNLPEVWTDSDKLEQIMTNLIDNAAKYSKNGTKVTVTAKFRDGALDIIQIKVIDQGIGIPEYYLAKIFTKFSRIDNPLTREVQGTGLGLYITKTIVENLGGKIYAKSREEGSVFTVEIPAATVEKNMGRKFTENAEDVY